MEIKNSEEFNMNIFLLVIVDSIIWALWSLLIGFSAHKLPDTFFNKHLFPVSQHTITRLERCGIKKWKDRVPEAGAMFRGGTSKKYLVSLNQRGLEVLVRESRRAELVHYGIVLITPVFFLFNPPILIVAMVLYAAIANIPCIAIQRYNRARCMVIMT